MKLTKADLVNTIATNNNMSKKDAREYVNIVLNGLVDLASGLQTEEDSLDLVGYLSITVRELGERRGTHPVTHLPLVKPSRKFYKAKLGSFFTSNLK